MEVVLAVESKIEKKKKEEEVEFEMSPLCRGAQKGRIIISYDNSCFLYVSSYFTVVVFFLVVFVVVVVAISIVISYWNVF